MPPRGEAQGQARADQRRRGAWRCAAAVAALGGQCGAVGGPRLGGRPRGAAGPALPRAQRRHGGRAHCAPRCRVDQRHAGASTFDPPPPLSPPTPLAWDAPVLGEPSVVGCSLSTSKAGALLIVVVENQCSNVIYVWLIVVTRMRRFSPEKWTSVKPTRCGTRGGRWFSAAYCCAAQGRV